MKKKIRALEEKILKHKALYYQGRPEISDKDYDKIEEDLRAIDPTNVTLEIVGTKVISSKKIKHDIKMLSLDKTYEREELMRWREGKNVVSVYKIDGTSCSLLYRGGKFFKGKTRGDGQYGEDISEKVLWIRDIPRVVSIENCEVRGEVYCSAESFLALAKEMEVLGLERPSSQRNIVAGLMGRKENIELCRYLSFFAFDFISEKRLHETEWEKIEYLERDFGFSVPPKKYCSNKKDVEEAILETKNFMDKGNYLIDGVVFSFDEIERHKALGHTAHHPRYRIAFKFVGESKKTEITNIIWTVSRNGYLVPVAEVKSVEISGAKISRVTLHNYAQVKSHELKPGDKIEITRSGEVIPKFLAKIKSSKEKFTVPKECPLCQSETKVEGVHLLCPSKKCPGRIKEEILNFIRKIGIDDLSSKRLDALLEKGLVKGISDLYRLDLKKLLTLEKTKEKLATKIFNEIEKSKEADLVTFLSALGISGGAYNKCEKVVKAGFNTLKKLEGMSVEDLCEVELFAEKSSEEFIRSFAAKKRLVRELRDFGFNPRAPDAGRGQLAGKKIVITGTLSRKRSEIEKEIKFHGGSVLGSISKGTDYLVTNEQKTNSGKAKKARELKIPIISEKDLEKMTK